MIPATILWRAGGALAAGAAVAFACWWVIDSLEERGRIQGRAEIRAEWDAAKEAQRKVDAAERSRLQTEFKEAAHAAQEQAARDRADAARARAAGDELRSAFAAAVKRCQGAAATGGSAAVAADSAVLADVQARIDLAAGELAEEADRARLAGATCERAFDAVNR